MILGIPMGMCAAIYRNHVADHVLMLVAIAGASIANFWLALIAMDTFSVKLGWLPLLGAEGWKSYILPSVCGIFPMAVMSRMTRSSMVDVLGEDYIRTASQRAGAVSGLFQACAAQCADPHRDDYRTELRQPDRRRGGDRVGV